MSGKGLELYPFLAIAERPALFLGICSQAIVANGFAYCPGSDALDPETGKLIDGDIKVHTHRCIKNLSNVLEAAGSDTTKVAKVNVKTLLLNTDVWIDCVAIL
ncbi:hypothetical protein BDV12DRAFT_210918 [Aspergillus spectabilis]